jgi:hypothetical protein
MVAATSLTARVWALYCFQFCNATAIRIVLYMITPPLFLGILPLDFAYSRSVEDAQAAASVRAKPLYQAETCTTRRGSSLGTLPFSLPTRDIAEHPPAREAG